MEERILVKSEYDSKYLKVITVTQIVLVVLPFVNQLLELAVRGKPIIKPELVESGHFWFAVVSLGFVIALAAIKNTVKKSSLLVTDRRVKGCTVFGKQVDLPVDSVTAIGKGAFSGITISTSSGVIKFIAIKNVDVIYNVLSQLLINRQRAFYQNNLPVYSNNVPTASANVSNTQEIKNYKELLDMGIITQAEFDQKKRELLGL